MKPAVRRRIRLRRLMRKRFAPQELKLEIPYEEILDELDPGMRSFVALAGH